MLDSFQKDIFWCVCFSGSLSTSSKCFLDYPVLISALKRICSPAREGHTALGVDEERVRPRGGALALAEYGPASQKALYMNTASTIWSSLEVPCQPCGSFHTIWDRSLRLWEPWIITTDAQIPARRFFHSDRVSGNPGFFPSRVFLIPNNNQHH